MIPRVMFKWRVEPHLEALADVRFRKPGVITEDPRPLRETIGTVHGHEDYVLFDVGDVRLVQVGSREKIGSPVPLELSIRKGARSKGSQVGNVFEYYFRETRGKGTLGAGSFEIDDGTLVVGRTRMPLESKSVVLFDEEGDVLYVGARRNR